MQAKSVTFKSNYVWLTLSGRRSISYRNQYIDLQSKLMDWFLSGRDLMSWMSQRLFNKTPTKFRSNVVFLSLTSKTVITYSKDTKIRVKTRNFYLRRNNDKVDFIETERIGIAHLLPWSQQENCYNTLFQLLRIKLYRHCLIY